MDLSALKNHRVGLFEKAKIPQRCPQFARRGPYDRVNQAATDTVKCTLTPIYAYTRQSMTERIACNGNANASASAGRYSTEIESFRDLAISFALLLSTLFRG